MPMFKTNSVGEVNDASPLVILPMMGLAVGGVTTIVIAIDYIARHAQWLLFPTIVAATAGCAAWLRWDYVRAQKLWKLQQVARKLEDAR